MRSVMRKMSVVLAVGWVLAVVWGDDLIVTRRSVDRCMNTLRSKIEQDVRRPTFIKTVRDIGYRFEMPGEDEAG